MSKISYKGDHKAFINDLFSEDFIKSSKVTAASFIEKMLDKITINKRTKKYIYPTNLFERLNYANGDQNPDLDYEIYAELNKWKISSETILSLLITDIISLDDRQLDYHFESFSHQTEDVQGLLVEELLASQHDTLPEYLFNKFKRMIYNFANEFDISDGRTDLETYNDKIKYYSNLEF